jgi:phosphatidylserine/phosphatidylglycerophosphate/cardiolipin synthase-like enzyme
MSRARSKLNLAGLTMSEGFFLLRRPEVTGLPFQAGDQDAVQGGATSSYRHVFTYRDSPQTIKDAAIKVVDSALQKVFLASFLLGDIDLLEALYRAADRLRGGVYVISALDEKSLRRGLAETEPDDAPEAADRRAHNKRFEDLTERGIAVRGHEDFHAKFIVADDRIALVSSANLETRAFETTGENGAVVTDPGEAARLGRFFARLWSSCTFEMPPGKVHTVQGRKPSSSPCRVPVPPVAEGNSLIWTYPGEQVILTTLHDVIGRAEHELLLATFGLTGLADHPELLVDPLAAAIGRRGRGLEVTMLVRSRNNLPGHRRDAGVLAGLGVTICADSLNHAKGVIADDAYGALFSANFDAQHGLVSGVEVGLRLDGTPALHEATRYFRHAMAYSDQVFDPHPSQELLDQRLAARWRKPWPLESPLRVRAETACWQRLVASVVVPPVLYVQARDGTVSLLAGTSSFVLGAADARGVRELSPSEQPGRSTGQVLEEWLTERWPGPEPRSGQPPAKGFCPAVIELVPSA